MIDFRKIEEALLVLGRGLAALRVAHGLTQEEVSDRAVMSYRHYQKLESGQLDFKMSTLRRLLQVYSLSAADFFSLLPGTDELGQVSKETIDYALFPEENSGLFNHQDEEMIYHASTAFVWKESGAIIVRIQEGSRQGLADAREVTSLCNTLSKEKSVAVIMDISRSKTITREARQHYLKSLGAKNTLTSIALVTESFTSKALANWFIKNLTPQNNIQVFESMEEASFWMNNRD